MNTGVPFWLFSQNGLFGSPIFESHCIKVYLFVFVYVCVHLWVPQCWSKDPIANDEMKLLQVRSGPVLQHAVALKTAFTIIKALSDLEYMAHNVDSSKTQNY